MIEVLVGRIGKAHGLRGDVTIDVRTDEPELRFADGAQFRAERPSGPVPTTGLGSVSTLTLSSSRWHSSVLLARFAEIPDRTTAEAARGLLLFVQRETNAAPADPDEFYDHQLIGLAAVDLDGRPLGTLTAVSHGSAQDLLTITTPEGRQALVPFVAALVPEVDVSAQRIVIADRPGLVTPFPDEA